MIPTLRAIARSVLPAAAALAVGILLAYWVARPTRGITPIVPSLDPDTSCGPVSLAIVSHWLDRPASIAELNRLTRVDESGVTSLLDLRRAATTLGFEAEAVRLDRARPIARPLPMILHLESNHFVAALPVDGDRLVTADPPNDPKLIRRADTIGDWSGKALVVAPTRSELEVFLAESGLHR